MTFDTPGDVNAITWGEFERDLQALGRSPRTTESYAEALSQVAAFSKDGDLLELRRPNIEAYLIHVRAHHSPATEQVRYRSLHRFYAWAEQNEMITVSPMHGMRMPSAPEKIMPVPETDELRALLAACAGDGFDSLRDTAIIRLMADTGIRLSECAGITLGRLDLKAAQVTVMGKGSRERTVPYQRPTGKALGRYLRKRREHPLAVLDALWLGSRGVALTANGIAQVLRRRCDQAGIRPAIRPHQLRHWCASEKFRHGLSDQNAMRIFGWRTLDMPRRYGAATGAQRAIEQSRAIDITGSL